MRSGTYKGAEHLLEAEGTHEHFPAKPQRCLWFL